MVDVKEGAIAEAEAIRKRWPIAGAEVDAIPARAVGVFVEGNDEPLASEAQLQDLDAVSRAGAGEPVNHAKSLELGDVGIQIEYPAAIELAATSSNWERAMHEEMIELHKLSIIADAVAARIELMRSLIREGLNLSEDKSFRCDLGTATLAAPSTSVEVFDRGQIPAGLMRIEPDAKRIGEILRAGGPIPGAMLVTKGRPTLRISWAKG